MRVLDLFSGIGGFSIGLERAGMRTVAFCEIEEYPRQVLAKHWPDTRCYEDVRSLTADAVRRDGIAVDVICGGFPCQDVSFAGKRVGLEGARSGLWSEYRRIIGELRPRFVIVENVPGLLNLGMGTVLGDLAALGYDAVWDCIPACAVGAPHRRDRVWIIAHANRQGEHDGAEHAEVGGPQKPLADTSGQRDQPDRESGELAGSRGHAHGYGHQRRRRRRAARCGGEDVADSDRSRRAQAYVHGDQGQDQRARVDATAEGRRTIWHEKSERGCLGRNIRNANVSGLAFPERQSRDVGEKLTAAVRADWWVVEPDVGRVADGVPARVDRLRALGNAVVPQIPEMIGRAILAASI